MRRSRSILLSGLVLLLSAPAFGARPPSQTGGVQENRYALLIAGISGDQELQKQFLGWIRELRDVLTGSLQFPPENITVLFDDPTRAPDLIQHKSTRENLEKVCLELSHRVRKEDLVFVFIAGHGNYQGTEYKLNLPGPDPTAGELAAMFYAIPAQRFVIVNTTTCSGGAIPALSQPGKLIISATKSGQEKNMTRLGGYFVEGFKDGAADLDKNGRVSVLEAFTYAAQKVEEYYSREGILQTEHPVLEDDGDGQPNAKPGPENGEGFLARTTYLDAGPARLTQGTLTPEQQALAREVQRLEQEIEALKYAKGDLPEAEYEKKLETLLLTLAETNAKLRKKP